MAPASAGRIPLLALKSGISRFRTPLKLESSAFVADGEGPVLAPAEPVFDAARNPGVTRFEGFAILQKYIDMAGGKT